MLATRGAFILLLEPSVFSYLTFLKKLALESPPTLLTFTLPPPNLRGSHKAVEGKCMTEDKHLSLGPQGGWFGEGLEEWFWGSLPLTPCFLVQYTMGGAGVKGDCGVNFLWLLFFYPGETFPPHLLLCAS